jgi:beta-carotene 15,15'-dioxygenase
MHPMNSLDWQGACFSCCALLLSSVLYFFPLGDVDPIWPILAACIVLLGVPHGALDTVFARRLYRVQGWRSWFFFSLLYLLLASLLLILWYFAPLLFLLAFFSISLVHFSGDLLSPTPAVSRFLYGGAIFVLPGLFFSSHLTRYFGVLLPIPEAQLVTRVLHTLSPVWLCGMVLAALVELGSSKPSRRWGALNIFSLGVLAVCTPPMLAFTLYFCLMHSARHILRTIRYSGAPGPLPLLRAAFLPMLGFLLFFVVALWGFDHRQLEERSLQLVFVSLAALTVPHMALVERVRLSGWRLNADI